jgi:hypothetical protein
MILRVRNRKPNIRTFSQCEHKSPEIIHMEQNFPNGIFKRDLPETCTDFGSHEGKKLFSEALTKGTSFSHSIQQIDSLIIII